MGRINAIAILATQVADVLILLLGVFLFVMSIIAFTSDFTKMYPELFERAGITMILMSAFTVVIVLLSIYGVRYQTRTTDSRDMGSAPTTKIFWTGKRLLILHNLCVLTLFLFSIFFFITIYSMLASFDKTNDKLADGISIEYDSFEREYSSRFNEFYFDAQNECASKYRWMWNLVEDECSYLTDSMLEEQCGACGTTTGTCAVNLDRTNCLVNNVATACPYDHCRYGFTKYFARRFTVAWVLAICVFVVLALDYITSTFLMCYNPEASYIQVLMKTGIIEKSSNREIDSNRLERLALFEEGTLGEAEATQRLMKRNLPTKDADSLVTELEMRTTSFKDTYINFASKKVDNKKNKGNNIK